MDGDLVTTIAFGALWLLMVVHSFVLLGVVHVVNSLAQQPAGRSGSTCSQAQLAGDSPEAALVGG